MGDMKSKSALFSYFIFRFLDAPTAKPVSVMPVDSPQFKKTPIQWKIQGSNSTVKGMMSATVESWRNGVILPESFYKNWAHTQNDSKITVFLCSKSKMFQKLCQKRLESFTKFERFHKVSD
eukprot:TRINITY_DN16686_c0_g1_i1.p2 TRINITY_DN16686_c0_g1~~TRINITY_DN16686_c0_g1_i1.p2  ORF type:complete len:121 (+),score=15.01 TRINITY_DN16686_c0_g1_i1:228-590(+)